MANEGLLSYLNRKEKLILGNNIKKLLEKKGGCWITPDIMCRDKIERVKDIAGESGEMFNYAMDVTLGISGRDMLENAFESKKDVGYFFEELGFSVSKSPEYGGDFRISSLKHISNPKEKEKVLSFAKNRDIYILRLDKK